MGALPHAGPGPDPPPPRRAGTQHPLVGSRHSSQRVFGESRQQRSALNIKVFRRSKKGKKKKERTVFWKHLMRQLIKCLIANKLPHRGRRKAARILSHPQHKSGPARFPHQEQRQQQQKEMQEPTAQVQVLPSRETIGRGKRRPTEREAAFARHLPAEEAMPPAQRPNDLRKKNGRRIGRDFFPKLQYKRQEAQEEMLHVTCPRKNATQTTRRLGWPWSKNQK